MTDGRNPRQKRPRRAPVPEAPSEPLQALAHKSRYSAVQLAQHPSTPAEVLFVLALRKERSVRRAVVENPNTPLGVLLQLGEEFPEELLRNPALDLAFLENPGFLEQMPERFVKYLLCYTQSEAWLRWALTRPNYRLWCSVACNSSLPPNLFESLASVKEELVNQCLAGNPACPPALLARLAQDEYFRVRLRVAENPATPNEVRLRLREDRRACVRRAASRHAEGKDPVESETRPEEPLTSEGKERSAGAARPVGKPATQQLAFHLGVSGPTSGERES